MKSSKNNPFGETPTQSTDLTPIDLSLLAIGIGVPTVAIASTDDTANVMKADGMAESIVEWMRKADLDERQCKAFSTMCCQFLLEFHSDKATEEDGSELNQSDKAAVEKDKDRLQNLVRLGLTGEIYYDQSTLFFHGPGGSGKSIVIDLLKAYAREYMKEKNGHNLGAPHVFLTVTPNDNNSIPLEINSWVTVDDEKDVTQH